jgi:hypothetical protein
MDGTIPIKRESCNRLQESPLIALAMVGYRI